MGFNSAFKGLIQLLVQLLCVSGRPVCRSVPYWPAYQTATNTK